MVVSIRPLVCITGTEELSIVFIAIVNHGELDYLVGTQSSAIIMIFILVQIAIPRAKQYNRTLPLKLGRMSAL